MADNILYTTPYLDQGAITLPLPNVGDLSDCESSDSESLNISITRPVKAFFLGCRKSILYTPQDLEEGRFRRHNPYSGEPLVAEDFILDEAELQSEKPSEPTVPNRHPLHDIDSSKLPAKKGSKLFRFLRWNYGSVYRRIFCLSVSGNVLAMTLVFLQSIWTGSSPSFMTASTAVSSNILAAMLVRNEHVVNALFTIFATWPKRLPLSIRRIFAKVYSYGGIHSGCSVAATLWYIVFLILMTMDFATTNLSVLRGSIYFVSYAIVILLCLIIVFALPCVRVRMHNWFEGMHRFAGWTAVFLFWTENLLLTADVASAKHIPYAMALALTPTFWILVGVTLLIAYPWTRLRLRDVEAEVLSDHCVKLNFKYTNVQYGQAVRLSDAPLRETHAFAAIPNPVFPVTLDEKQPPISPNSLRTSISTDTNGFSVLVSNAGDWTKKIIRNPPKQLYTRGAPQYGVLRVAGMFSPVIIMATGSGIGPCLSLFVQKPDHPVRIIWSTASPAETYGQEIIDLLYRADPGAVIIDTRKTGRPDLVKIAYRMWEGSRREGARGYALGKTGRSPGRCEAVVVISNQKVTKKVVYGLETRGVPAYGAIFDS
ncbi:hypothetical protein CONLIGDRAFT_624709 [Coniochaeta ligniaria NRRL 30616]|uniref:Integral membrane protein TmpA n=1 Tax=Coniochaeta ligniaria NRRL 30616 TaxID=1408157 RepID=A0A1J7IQZ4_9PEZI|nr:hypothetical protein CONLIGDRAFT_624709 [Coniochaeta ligniaria NRRL 30616]